VSLAASLGLALSLSALAPEVTGTRRSAPSSPVAGVESEVPRLESARAPLDHATRCKPELRGREGEARRGARAAAVEAYRAVRRHFPRGRALGAEAAFRAGELLRAQGAEAEALAEFTAARRLGARTEFAARAELEIGHVHRRAKRAMEALAAYERVLTDPGADSCVRDRAGYWAGRVHASLGRGADARRAYERVARDGVDPTERVRAFDAWADSLIDEGDLEGAAGVLELCRVSLDDVALEETELGQRVREALERMSSVERLVGEVEERLRRRARRGEEERSDEAPPPRLGPRVPRTSFADGAGASDTATWTTTLSVRAGKVVAGGTKYYQVWYRNPLGSPCGSDSDSSGGCSVAWSP